MEDMIVMDNVWKAYPNGVMALNGIDLSVGEGEFIYIVGPSGAGKSTFIKMIFRELKPTRGKIIVDHKNIATLRDRQVPYFRRKIGVVFQDFRLLPKLTVYENVAFALEVIEESPRVIKRRVMEVLDLVGLKHKANSFPGQLSGGEQQRVSIARSICNRPPVLIADEPTGNLDPETSWQIMDVFKRINEQGTTVVMATHNREIVNSIKHRVVALEDGMIVRDEEEGAYGYEA
jgi:cell division transport system ATP-binding protein